MSKIKTEKYYDVGCDICAKHLSTDFTTGMAPSVTEARLWAKEKGFKSVKGYNLCVECYGEYKSGCIKLPNESE